MITTFSELPEIRRRHSDERLVFGGGSYDIIHEGHVESLEWRRTLGDLLVVGVSSDERVRQRKGDCRPIQPELARLTVVAALRAVDFAFIMPMPAEMNPTMQVLHALQPDVFVDGVENTARWDLEAIYMASLGVRVILDSPPRKNSTTAIIENVLRTAAVH